MPAMQPAMHGRDHCPGGSDPIPCWPTTNPWAIVTDGYVDTNSGVSYSIGGQYYGSNDVAGDYYAFTQRNTTYPSGSYDYFTVYVVQRGIYLIDAQLTIQSWTVTDGYAELDLNPNKEAWYPFGFGTAENDTWVDYHVTHDSVNGQVNSFFRVNGIASLDSATEFLPTFRQVTGSNNLGAAVNFLKIVRLQDYEVIGDLLTGTIV